LDLEKLKLHKKNVNEHDKLSFFPLTHSKNCSRPKIGSDLCCGTFYGC
jgi:hypothetical protein